MSPYVPQSLPLAGLDFARLIRKIGPANAALARYDGLLQSAINPRVMLSPLTNREAVLSSKIEGTQATVDEVLEYEAGMEFGREKVQDIQEIVNYRKALTLATEALADRPLTLSLIRSMHAVLMDSVRGADKTPGQFRVNQNWLGPDGCEIDQATFVPPSPLQLLDHLEAFERYLASADIDALIQVAVVHAQFELIHPFQDGNGRIGRLLMMQRVTALTRAKYALQVLDALFDRPVFQSSDFVERSGIPRQSASRFLGILRKANILQTLRDAGGRQPAVLAFRDLLNCAEGRTVL